MAYELRIDGVAAGRFDRSEDAVAQARQAVRGRPDCAPEIFDLATGKPFAPAASHAWQEDLAGKVGF
jgi:hypothetical protein